MRKLFCSFTSTLRLIHEEKVTDEDLNNGLFAFGCVREHAFHPENDETNEVTWLRDATPERQQEVHTRLVAALEAAEAAGRVAWRPVDDSMSLNRVNELLTKNGFTALEGDPRSSNYPALQEAVEASGQDLGVVWR